MKIIVWGWGGKYTKDIVKELSSSYDVVEWISDPPWGSLNIYDMFNVRYENFKYTIQYPSNELYMYLLKSFRIFCDMFSRHFRDNQLQFHDLLDIFNILSNWLYTIFVNKSPDIIIFGNLPHEGPDYILYLIAKFYNKKTLLFYQSLFENRFYIVQELEDFGKFETSKIIYEYEYKEISIKRNQWFYMKNVKRYNYSVVNLFTDLLLRRNYYMVIKYFKYKKYINNLKSLIIKNISLKNKYVYFPLAMQPELTTSCIGDIYTDQILALERLDQILPEDFLIYVKENPKQTEFQRNIFVFKRLKKLKKVVFVNINTNTFDLIENSVFVATVTGTAGWEALLSNKNVLVFGNPWYKNFPGVFHFDPSLDIKAILNYRINKKELFEAYSRHLQKMGEGVVDDVWSCIVNNFSAVENAKNILRVIESYIN